MTAKERNMAPDMRTIDGDKKHLTAYHVIFGRTVTEEEAKHAFEIAFGKYLDKTLVDSEEATPETMLWKDHWNEIELDGILVVNVSHFSPNLNIATHEIS